MQHMCPFLHPVTSSITTVSILIRDGEVPTLYMECHRYTHLLTFFEGDLRVAPFPPLPRPRVPDHQRCQSQSLTHNRCWQPLVLDGGLVCNSSRSSIICMLVQVQLGRPCKPYHRRHHPHGIERETWYASHTRHCLIRRCVDSRGGVTIGLSLATLRSSYSLSCF